MVKYFETTAYNCLLIPIIQNESDNIGYIIFVNKHIEKERMTFNKHDELLSIVTSNIVKIFFEIYNMQAMKQYIANK